MWFGKVKEPNGWMGNMSPFPIKYNGEVWLTVEALFQAMRYNDPIIQAEIRNQKSPMGAKLVSKKNEKFRIVEAMSAQDVANMEACVLLKFQQHPELAKLLRATGNQPIYEDATKRHKINDLFWGAQRDPNSPNMPIRGQNKMGEILMKVRSMI